MTGARSGHMIAATDATKTQHAALSSALAVATEATCASGAALIESTEDDLTGAAPLGVDSLWLSLSNARPRQLGLLDLTARLVRQAWVWTRVARGANTAAGRARRANLLSWLREKLEMSLERDGKLSLLLVEFEDEDMVARMYGAADLEDRVPVYYNAVERAIRGVDTVYRCDEATLAIALPRCDARNAAKVAGRVREALSQVSADRRRQPGLRARIRTYSHPGELAAFATPVSDEAVGDGDPHALSCLWTGFVAGTFEASAALFSVTGDGHLQPVVAVGTKPPDPLPRSADEALAGDTPLLVTNPSSGKDEILFVPLRDDQGSAGLLMIESARAGLGPAAVELVTAIASHLGPLVRSAAPHAGATPAAPRERPRRHQYDNIIGQGASMREVFDLLDRVVDTEYPVIIQGESGTGKELIARAIHYNGSRADKPLIAENCGALNENLLEAELFGYEKGSFTGAETSRKGLFELADGGTLFLDEVADMKPSMQKDLLRILQEGIVRPVGSKKFLRVDVRVVCASNNDLAQLVEQGEFRSDLFYRLNVWSIQMPPLRDRPDDIILLVDHFLDTISEQTGTPRKTLGGGVLDALVAYDWPGNVRQLKNEMARMVAMAPGDEIVLRDFSKRPSAEAPRPSLPDSDDIMPLSELERHHIMRALRFTNGNRTRAAELLGINKATIYRKLKAYGEE